MKRLHNKLYKEHTFRDVLCFSKKNSLLRKVSNSQKTKTVKNVNKKSQLRKFFKYV